MDNAMILKLLKPILPFGLGALGGLFAATYPSLHIAFCSGSLL